MANVVTLVTGKNALRDFKILLETLGKWHSNEPPTVYVYTDTQTVGEIRALAYKGTVKCQEALNRYSGMSRKQMETIKGTIYKTLWTDFMAEKINALRWAFSETGSAGCWFLDADICLCAPLPEMPPATDLALSPHEIRAADEARYGRYNGGFLWMKSTEFLDIWAEATRTSRFFEQAALEECARAAQHLYEFPLTVNFGWWRLWQSSRPPHTMQALFGFNRSLVGSGLTLVGTPLQSVHTHFYEKDDIYTIQFNSFLVQLLEKLGKHRPAQDLLKIIRSA